MDIMKQTPTVIYVGTKPTIVEERLARSEERENDSELSIGKIEIVDEGMDGVKTTITTYEVNTEDGTVTLKTTVNEVSPRPKRIKVGIKPTTYTHVLAENLTISEKNRYDLAADFDGDGYSNEAELIARTNPDDKQSFPLSMKSLKDLTLPNKSIYDLNADNDQDGYTNLDELIAGSDPNDKKFTPLKATSPTNLKNEDKPVYDLSTDTDNDGYNNDVELILGSNPNDETSIPHPKVAPLSTPTVEVDKSMTDKMNTETAMHPPKVSAANDTVSSESLNTDKEETLPDTGEADISLIFGTAALSILASLGLVSSRYRDEK